MLYFFSGSRQSTECERFIGNVQIAIAMQAGRIEKTLVGVGGAETSDEIFGSNVSIFFNLGDWNRGEGEIWLSPVDFPVRICCRSHSISDREHFTFFREVIKALPRETTEAMSQKMYLRASELIMTADVAFEGSLNQVEALRETKDIMARKKQVNFLNSGT